MGDEPIYLVGERGPDLITAQVREWVGEGMAAAALAGTKGLDPIAFAKGASRARKLPKWKRAWLWIKAI